MSLIEPNDVISYSEFPEVQERTPERLKVDIMRAERDVFRRCGHKFTDKDKYPSFPEEAKMAITLLSEYYALISMEDAPMAGYASEEANGTRYTFTESKKPDVDDLLIDFIHAPEQEKFTGNTFMRMRRL